MSQRRDNFQEALDKAINDPILRGALSRFADAYLPSRAKAYDGVDFPALRRRIAEAKGQAGKELDRLVERFKAEAARRGAVVYEAKSGADVKAYITKLALERGVRSIVKSKSMASEEIHLNEALAGAGIEVNETDLGEWIIQLAGQRPSHMVMPAIHLSKEQVAGYFSKELEESVAPDIPLMVQKARAALREKFLTADMGITGANIAVAETGTLVLLTNEGNARLTTTLPPIHVALVGYEKIVADMKAASDIIEALPKSATGQLITSYVTMITGAVPTRAEGETRPKELHIILMDNGRRDMLADPEFSQAWQCIRCASCLNVCPAYQMVGGHVFGHTYAGGIGTILTAFLNPEENPLDHLAKFQNLCLGCGRCTDYCPGGIDVSGLILKVRERVVRERGLPAAQKALMAGVVGNRKWMHTLLRLAAKAQKPFREGAVIRHLPLFFSGLTEFRSLPAIAEEPFRDREPRVNRKPQKPVLKANFFVGCLMDFAYPQQAEAVYRVLQAHGVEVHFPRGQACCGAPAKYTGDMETVRKLAKQNIEALEEGDPDVVVGACPTCLAALIHDFADVLQDEEEWRGRALALAAKVKDFSQLVAELREAGEGPSLALAGGGTVTYHDSCHYKRHLKLEGAPRALLQGVEGLELKEMEDCDRCCGLAGSFSVKFPRISKPILERKLQRVEESGAGRVAMDCPGCILQIGGGLDKRGSSVRAVHTAELLAEALKEEK